MPRPRSPLLRPLTLAQSTKHLGWRVPVSVVLTRSRKQPWQQHQLPPRHTKQTGSKLTSSSAHSTLAYKLRNSFWSTGKESTNPTTGTTGYPPRKNLYPAQDTHTVAKTSDKNGYIFCTSFAEDTVPLKCLSGGNGICPN